MIVRAASRRCCEKAEKPSAFILFRGEYDKRRDPVTAATPGALPPFPKELPHNRLGFAQWLLRPDQPLTPLNLHHRPQPRTDGQLR